MFRTFGASPYQLTATKDQSEFLKTVLPKNYSLVQIRNKSHKNEMTIEELRFWESGGSYDFDPLDFEELIKNEEEVDWKVSTEGGSSVEQREINQACQGLICKMEDNQVVIEELLEEEFQSESLFNPVQILMEQESELNCDPVVDKQESLIEGESLLSRLPSPDPPKTSIQSKTNFSNNFNLIAAPQHLLSFIEKTGARRRQRRLKKKEKASLDIDNPPEPVSHTKKVHAPTMIPVTQVAPLTTTILQLPQPSPSKTIKPLTTQQKHYLFILQQLFEKPLSAGDLEHLGYSLIEHKQLNINVIQSNIRSNKYEHLQQLHRDLLMVWLTTYSFKPQDASSVPCQSSVKVFDKSQLKSYLFDNNSCQPPTKPKTNPSLPISKFSIIQRQKIATQIKSLSKQHLIGVWNIVTEGTQKSNYDIVFDLQTMSDDMLEKLVVYLNSICTNVQQNKKQIQGYKNYSNPKSLNNNLNKSYLQNGYLPREQKKGISSFV